MADAELERARKLWDRYSVRYDRRMERTERALFPGGREWACGQAGRDVLEVAVGTGRNAEAITWRATAGGCAPRSGSSSS